MFEFHLTTGMHGFNRLLYCKQNSLPEYLTHLPQEKMAAISQTMFSDAFLWMGSFAFWLKFHWSLFLRVQLTVFHHWFRWWLGAGQATSHYLNQWWLTFTDHICVTRPQWVINSLRSGEWWNIYVSLNWAIIWTDADILSIGPSLHEGPIDIMSASVQTKKAHEMNVYEIWIKSITFLSRSFIGISCLQSGDHFFSSLNVFKCWQLS